MVKFFIVFLFVFIMSVSLRAATGCVPNSNTTRIHTSYNSSTGNYRANTFSTLGVGCAWNFISPSTACNVGSGVGAGFLAVDSPQFCPIDDYIWVLMILFGGLGYFVLRKNALKPSLA